MLRCGNFPVQWSQDMINPLHKSENKTKPADYRRIRVLVTLRKLIESVLNGRLISKNKHFEEDDIVQAGFLSEQKNN